MAKQLTRPERWAEALAQATNGVADLVELQTEYQDWQDNMTDSMDFEVVGERLEAVVGLDLGAVESILVKAGELKLPLGFGRDDED